MGGEVEAFQRLGREEDNSRFLDPNPQRATRLELQYTQPLLKGAGRAYNQSLIVLAQIQLDRSSDVVADELEDHLVKVTEAYWELYRTRAEFLQRRKLLASAKSILANLEGRREVDAVERQVFRARTAVADRESEMLRAETRIRNWQSQVAIASQRSCPCLCRWLGIHARRLALAMGSSIVDVGLASYGFNEPSRHFAGNP